MRDAYPATFYEHRLYPRFSLFMWPGLKNNNKGPRKAGSLDEFRSLAFTPDELRQAELLYDSVSEAVLQKRTDLIGEIASIDKRLLLPDHETPHSLNPVKAFLANPFPGSARLLMSLFPKEELWELVSRKSKNPSGESVSFIEYACSTMHKEDNPDLPDLLRENCILLDYFAAETNDYRTNNGATLLMLAARAQNPAYCKTMLDNGIELGVCDRFGQSAEGLARDWACMSQNSGELSAIIERAGLKGLVEHFAANPADAPKKRHGL